MIAYTISRPTCPSCLEPALPTQTTLQRSGLGVSSSKISSTTWPPKVETSAQPETFSRGIEDETGEPLRLAIQIDDQAGAPLRHHTIRAAGFAGVKARHSFKH